MKIGICRRDNKIGRFLELIGQYFRSIGHETFVTPRKPPFDPAMQGLIIWNGEKPSMRPLVEYVKKKGGQVIHAEHGYLRRKGAWQLDPCGINANSSNRLWLSFPEPNEREIVEIQDIRDSYMLDYGIRYEEPEDYILVVLQTPTDVNLTVHAPQYANQGAFSTAVKYAAKGLTDARLIFRQHPKIQRGTLPPLREHLNRCRYVITINSNTVHEALVAQKDCICLGPHIYTGVNGLPPGEGGVVFDCALSVRKIANAIVAAEERLASDQARHDPIRDAYLHYVWGREWVMDDVEEGRGLLELMEGRPKALNSRVKMHEQWSRMRSPGLVS